MMAEAKTIENKGLLMIRVGGVLGLLFLNACSGTAATPVPAGTQSSAGYGSVCKAGFYTCHTPYQVPLGSPCSCPGLGAPSYGNVHAK